MSAFANATNLFDAFDHWATATPKHLAVRSASASLSYAELAARVESVALSLQDAGVEPGSLVGACLDRGVMVPVVLLGILRAGCAYVPLDPINPESRLRLIAGEAGLEVVVADEPNASLAASLASTVVLASGGPGGASAAPPTVGPEDLAYVIFTSGSTGVPKGVQVTHGNVLRLFTTTDALFDFSPEDVWVLFHSYAFDFAVWEMWGALGYGGTLVVPRQDVVKRPNEVTDLLEREQVTVLCQTPSAFRSLTARAGSEATIGPKLRWVIFGGERLDARILRRWVDSRGDSSPTLVNMYGITETTVHVTFRPISAADTRMEHAFSPIGEPIPDLTVRLLGPTLDEVPDGEPGEMYVSGPGVARGYLGRPQLTAERFLKDSTGAVMYRSGDIARRVGGELVFEGRMDDQVQLRGYRVELGEVEVALRGCEGVADAVVVAADLPIAEDKTLVAYVVPDGEHGEQEVLNKARSALAQRLPAYMVPSLLRVIPRIPLTPNGKLDRDVLPSALGERPQLMVPYVAPSTRLERQVAAVWSEFLGIAPVGVTDPFFDLGGTSLVAALVVNRLGEILGRPVPVLALFENPSVEALAGMLARTDQVSAAEDVPVHLPPVELPRGEDTPIAVVGMACRVAGADDVETFWRNLVDSVESVRDVTVEDLTRAGVDPSVLNDPDYVPRTASLADVDKFDARFFGYVPADAELIDPQQRLFLELVWQALEDAAYDPRSFPGRIGVFGGIGRNDYLVQYLTVDPQRRAEATGFAMTLGNEKDFPSTRAAFKLNLRGPAFTVQSACSTTGVATHLACQSLKSGECDMAVVAGCRILLPSGVGYQTHEGGVTSRSGHLRAFDASADGMIRGSGGGAIVLKPLDAAEAAGDSIYAVIRGSAINNDGSTKIGYTAPSPTGQEEVVALALTRAGVDPATVTYVEAHGTGTILGDPIEVSGLTGAFRRWTDRVGYCALGSVKTNVGHLDAGACVVGLIKTSLALRHGIIPASLHFEAPNPEIDFERSPFFVARDRMEWQRNGAPRRAGVSAFGIGGTNAHIVLEEAPDLGVDEKDAPELKVGENEDAGPSLLLLSARSQEALDAMSDRLADHLTRHPEQDLRDVAYSLQTGRARFDHRRVVVASDHLTAADAIHERRRSDVLTGLAPSARHPIVFLLPGGGAQYIGMARNTGRFSSVFQTEMDRGIGLFEEMSGFDLRTILYPSPSAESAARVEFERPSLQLPALFIVEVALARMWMSLGIEPSCLLGHSLGENTAAHLSGIMSYQDALGLVWLRGRLFERVPPGGMLSISASADEALSHLDSALRERVDLAVVNAPDSCVLSGTDADLESVQHALETAEVDVRRVPIAIAAHSRHVESILSEFGAYLAGIDLRKPEIPVVSNRSGRWLTNEEATSPEYWVAHLRGTVRFSDCVATLLEEPHVFVEAGPGRILGSLVRSQNPSAATIPSLRHPEEDVADDHFLAASVGQLWLAGAEADWEALQEGGARRRVSLPTYPFERQSYWISRPATSALEQTAGAGPGPSGPPESLAAVSSQGAATPPTSSPDIPPTSQATAVVPRLERLLGDVRTVVATVSGFQPEDLAADARFVELGFDSLFMARIAGALRKEFSVRLSVRSLMESYSSIDAVARKLDEDLSPDYYGPPAAPASTAEDVAPASVMGGSIATDGTASESGGERGGGMLERVIQQQMEIMRQQLELLRGGVGPARSEPAPPPDSPAPAGKAAAAAPSGPAPATSGNAAGPSTTDSAPWKPVSRAPAASEGLTSAQQAHIDGLVQQINERTPSSKHWVQEHRSTLSDPRTVQGFRAQWKEMVYPLVSDKAQGSRIWDIDGNEYIDLVCGYGVTLFGHRPDFVTAAVQEQLEKTVAIGPQSPLAGEVAALVCELTGMDRAAFCNTGSEAVLAGIRMARTVTGRPRIAMFSRHYHGIFDEVLVRSYATGSTRSSAPIAPGIPQKAVDDVLVLDYGDPASFDLLRQNADEIALCLVEPVRSRNPDYQPWEYLRELRQVTQSLDIPLLMDEMITGFRSHPGGVQHLAGVRADLATYGKVIGGGFPIGVVAGRKEFMDALDGGDWRYGDDSRPEADMTWFAGTFVRHPAALAASRASLLHLKERGPSLQEDLNARTERFVDDLNAVFAKTGAPLWAERFASMFFLRFESYEEFSPLLFYHLHRRGVYTYEGRPGFLTTSHSDADMEHVVHAFEESIVELQEVGLLSKGVQRAQPDGPVEIPMTPGQQEIWLNTLRGDDASCAYNLCSTLDLTGSLDVGRLQEALDALVERHEALRAVPSMDGKTQRILPTVPVPIELIDLSAATQDERDASLSKLRHAEVSVPFDLTNGPLVRAKLVRLSADTHQLLLTAHHMICDGWSCGVLLRNLGELYAAKAEGRPASLPGAMQLHEWVAEVETVSASEEGIESMDFWAERLADAPRELDLPADRPRPPVKTYAAKRIWLTLSELESERIREGAKHVGTTLFVMLLSGFHVLLHWLTGAKDLVVGFSMAGQGQFGDRDLVGHCVSFLPIRTPIDPSMSFGDHAHVANAAFLDAVEYQHCTFGELVRRVAPPRDKSRVPLAQVAFNLDPSGLGVSFHDLGAHVGSVPREFENMDAFFNVVELPDRRLEIQCTFNLDLFDEGRVRDWLVSLRDILLAAAGDWALPVTELAASIAATAGDTT